MGAKSTATFAPHTASVGQMSRVALWGLLETRRNQKGHQKGLQNESHNALKSLKTQIAAKRRFPSGVTEIMNKIKTRAETKTKTHTKITTQKPPQGLPNFK